MTAPAGNENDATAAVGNADDISVAKRGASETAVAASDVNDTIVALATPPAHESGDGAIGIIRVSGPEAFSIAGRIFRGKKPFEKIKPYSIGYGSIYDVGRGAPENAAGGKPDCEADGDTDNEIEGGKIGDSGGAVDEALIIKMRAPKSYTREDVVEIHCHAGAGVLRRILRLVMREGARAAQPGEFTRRAFLNGRIDLSQAEAVMDLIRAGGEAGAAAAMRQLEGKLSENLRSVRETLIDLIASLEAFLDFPEHDVPERDISEVCDALYAIELGLAELAASFEYGRAAREGVTAVIAGRPNVGKSTLLNLFAGAERAIVTEIPGTTRDVIEEYKNLGGFTVRFLDTAGVRETADPVESAGVARSYKAIEQADLALLVFDADAGFTAEDARLIRLAEGKKRIAIINKTDLADSRAVDGIRAGILAAAATPGIAVIEAALICGEGLVEIEDAIRRLYSGNTPRGYGGAILTNARHYALVARGIGSARAAAAALRAGLPLEMPIIDMRDALDALGEITGEKYSEDVIERIFSEFCVGK